MKKTIPALLVILALLLALGGSALAESPASQEKTLLVKKTVKGQSLPDADYAVTGRIFDLVTEYYYDESGALVKEQERLEYPVLPELFRDGEELEKFVYTYTDTGAVETVTLSNRVINGKRLHETLRFADGHVVEDRITASGLNGDALVTAYVYGDSGLVVREENTEYYALFFNEWNQVPVVDNYEFDGQGYCTRWEHEDADGAYTVSYAYDGDGNLTRLEAAAASGKTLELLELRWENGLLTGLTRTADGKSTDYSFDYNEDGLPSAMRWESGGKQKEVLYSYNADGYLEAADWRENGKSTDKTSYKYKTGDKGAVKFEMKGKAGPYVFGPERSKGTAFNPDEIGEDGLPSVEYRYTLQHVFTALRYVETETDYSYETRTVPVKGEK